ncbi:putative membrane protein [Saccharothrix tamanrassetensis]|uniref:Putative membrane protein n=1 Tax=Saccharothrix tamanrassetensis TaxID=1051531 RepID=A0A841CBX1_9PSEU|nr:hypothetical protein [Saccharothrix tamanrassetensis]MBB5953668.1 putative membrane protein [Saccharothrix tamanrassetensis]
MKVAFVVVMTTMLGALLFVLGAIVVKVVPGIPGALSTFGAAIARGEVVALLGLGGIVLGLVVLVVMWRGAAPGGVHRRGHWEYRGEDKYWVSDDRD